MHKIFSISPIVSMGKAVGDIWPSHSFLSGIALSAPLVANIYPIRLDFLLLIPFVANLLLRRVQVRPLFRPSFIYIVILAFVACHSVALLLGTSSFSRDVLTKMAWAGVVSGIIILALNKDDRPQDIALGLFFALCITAIPIAAAGLAKYTLQLNNLLLGGLIGACSGAYPQGTSFCGDYNVYSLYLGMSAIGAIFFIFSSRDCSKVFLFQVGLAIILLAGMFAGSRRFPAMIVLVVLFWVVRSWKCPLRGLKLALIPLVLISLVNAYLTNPNNKPYFSEFVTLEQVVARTFNLSPVPLSAVEILKKATGGDPSSLSARSVSIAALADTYKENYGFGSRMDRWKLAWSMIQENGYFWGRGFSYQKEFSCRFSECEHLDYPHSPILSAWIAFGALGLFLALSFYLMVGINLILAGKLGLLSGASFVALAPIPYSMLSGDTIFSLPHMIVGALIVDAAVRVRMVL